MPERAGAVLEQTGTDVAATRAAPRRDLALTATLYLALLAAALPLTRVVAPGAWIPGIALLAALLLAVGAAARRLGVPSAVASVLEIVVWVLAVTLVFFRESALAGIVPTPQTLAEVPVYVQVASNEIFVGVSPVAATKPLSFVIFAALGAVVVALDHVVVTARMPLLASVALVAIWLIPAVAVPSAVHVAAFVLLAATMLAMVRAETRTREGAPRTGRARGTGAGFGVAAVAAVIGFAAIAVTVVATPTLPAASTADGPGTMAAIDASLNLGEDLRRPTEVEVLRVRSDAPSVPYLRAATLSQFDGERWEPDRQRSTPLDRPEPFGPLEVDEDIRVTEYRTTVEVGQLVGVRLPVAFPAIAVTGTEGAWRAVPFNRTVVTSQSSAHGQGYEVVTHQPRPTREQIRAADATVHDGVPDEAFGLPADMPPIIAETAREITAGQGTDYDRLTALQAWFRGSSFTYSLDAPVADDFDGAGVDAVADFLRVREGYCVHFASAFALMARTLEMPSRIVVGFLPGTATGESVDGERINSVTTSMLHAWPEVHFRGIGWVAFEPTKSLGTPTNYLPSAIGVVDDGGQDVSGPTPEAPAAPTGALTPRPEDGRPADADAGATGSATVDLAPLVATLLAAAAVAALPALVGAARRRTLRRRARGGDAGAAWRLAQDAALDLGIPVPAALSPRAFGARLVAEHGAPAADVATLVAAIERASYAPAGFAGDGGMLAAAAAGVHAGLRGAASRGSRVAATLAPRSLVVRPGAVAADAAVRAGRG